MCTVLDDDGMASGVAFAITPRHLLTAAHNVSAEAGDQVLCFSKSVQLRAPVFAQQLTATVVGGSLKQDWAVLKLEDATVRMAPAAIVDKDFEPEVTDEVALFTMNVAHANEARSSPKVRIGSTTVDAIAEGSLMYDASTFPGDSGSPLMHVVSGLVIGIHVLEFNVLAAATDLSETDTSDFLDVRNEASVQKFEACNQRRAAKKRAAAANIPNVEMHCEQGTLDNLTVADLKRYLRARGKKTEGLKKDLKQRISDLLGVHQLQGAPAPKRPRSAETPSSQPSGGGSLGQALPLSVIVDKLRILCGPEQLVHRA